MPSPKSAMVINFFIDEKAISSKNPSMRFVAEAVARKSLVVCFSTSPSGAGAASSHSQPFFMWAAVLDESGFIDALGGHRCFCRRHRCFCRWPSHDFADQHRMEVAMAITNDSSDVLVC